MIEEQAISFLSHLFKTKYYQIYHIYLKLNIIKFIMFHEIEIIS